jgi:hypothetical protein
MSSFEALARYHAGLGDDAEAAQLEEQLFADPELAREAAWLDELGGAVRELSAMGPLIPVITPAQLAVLRASGPMVMDCRPEQGTVNARIGPGVELVAARLPVSLEGVRTLDIELARPDGTVYYRAHDAPFEPHAAEVVLLCERHVTLAAADIRVRLKDQHSKLRAEFVLLASEVGG